MSQDQHEKSGDRGRRRDRFEFYYYEKIGNFYYLRITRFSLYLMIVLGVAVLIFSILESRGGRPRGVDVKITTPDPTPSPTPSLELRPAPSFQPPTGQSTGAGMPARRRSPSPTPTPPATPAEPPSPDPTQSPFPPGLAG